MMIIDPVVAAQAIGVTGDAVIMVDDRAEITFWNRAAEALFGYKADEAVGQSLAMIIPGIHRPAHMAGFHSAMDTGHLSHGGQPARVEGAVATGQVIPLVMSLGLLESGEGTAIGAIAILRRGDDAPISFI